LPSAVLLFRLAHQKTVQLAADHSHCADDGIGAHGQAANGLRAPSAGLNLLLEHLASKTRALRSKGSSAAINVVIAGAAGGKLKLAQAEGLLGQHLQKLDPLR